MVNILRINYLLSPQMSIMDATSVEAPQIVCSYLDTSPNILFGRRSHFLSTLMFSGSAVAFGGVRGICILACPRGGKDSITLCIMLSEQTGPGVSLHICLGNRHMSSFALILCTEFPQLRQDGNPVSAVQKCIVWSVHEFVRIQSSCWCVLLFTVLDKDREHQRLTSLSLHSEDMSPDTGLSAARGSDAWGKTQTLNHQITILIYSILLLIITSPSSIYEPFIRGQFLQGGQ